MCGIGGQVGNAVDRNATLKMINILQHRGPDGSGTFENLDGTCVLVHRRLSIIDLSSAGKQPMCDPSKRWWITYNGEIYNYVEIRRELESEGELFITNTDTEVLLRAYVRWGREMFPRLLGMFSFAIYDSIEHSLFAARDRFGVKPFFYSTFPSGTISFASEIKALLADGRVSRQADPRALADFLQSGATDHRGEHTFFAAVRSLLPGCFLNWKEGRLSIQRYWELSPKHESGLDLQKAVVEVRGLLRDSIRLRLRSDVLVGATLSGGLDSSLLVALTSEKISPPFKIFLSHLKNDPRSEEKFARLLLAAVRTTRSTWVEPSADSLKTDLADLVWHQEEPFADTSVYAHYCLMRAARAANVPVVLSGQGADEVFAGYLSYYRAFLGELVAGRRFSLWRAELSARSQVSGESLSSLVKASLYHAVGPLTRNFLFRFRARFGGVPLTSFGRALVRSEGRFEQGSARVDRLDGYLKESIEKWALPHLLRHDDRNSMAFGVESRQPYLDHRLVEFVFSTSSTLRLQKGWSKALLREAADGLVPSEIQWRKDKVAFSTPMRQWIDALRPMMEPKLMESSQLDRLVDRRRFEKVMKAFWSGDDELLLPVWWTFITRVWMDTFSVTI